MYTNFGPSYVVIDGWAGEGEYVGGVKREVKNLPSCKDGSNHAIMVIGKLLWLQVYTI